MPSSRIALDDPAPVRPSIPAANNNSPPAAPEEPVQPRSSAPPPPPPVNDNQPPEPSGEATPPEETDADRLTKLQARYDRLTRERYEERRRADDLQAQMAEFQRQQAERARPPGTPPDPFEQGRQQGRQEAQSRQLEEQFARECNDLFAKGQQEYGEGMFAARDAMNAVGWGSRPDALAALTQLDNGHQVYRRLAGNLDEAARILALPPMRMAMELTRMSNSMRTVSAAALAPANDNSLEPVETEVSRLPAPRRIVGGNSPRGELRLDDPKLPMADFIRRRDKEERRSRILR